MFDDYYTSLKAYLYDRVSSPLLGAFTFSWALWNYKFILVVFSGYDVEKKFGVISGALYPSWGVYGLYWLLFPLLTSAAFIFLYPYPAKWVYRFWRARQKKLKDIRQRIDDDVLLTAEESRKLRAIIFEMERKHDEIVQKIELEKSVLEEQIGKRDYEVLMHNTALHPTKNRFAVSVG